MLTKRVYVISAAFVCLYFVWLGRGYLVSLFQMKDAGKRWEMYPDARGLDQKSFKTTAAT